MHWAELPADFNRPYRFELEFTEMFGIPFQSITNIKDDDGVTHYINTKTKDVYSYDTFKRKWLEKNVNRDSVLQDDGMRFLVSPEEQNLEIEKRIKSRKRPGMNPYGGMGISEEERRLRMEEIEYIQKYRVL